MTRVAKHKPRSAMALVIFAVCMVSYSGPMVKGALNEGASPISVALLRMVAAGVLLLPFDLRRCARRRIPFAAIAERANTTRPSTNMVAARSKASVNGYTVF